ncbi:MAG: hypothetical protein F6K19_10905 [Cyanothece sp. SIO1E1]|nr:hypothetical protein [Cyanothece sp. SIO1E1]
MLTNSSYSRLFNQCELVKGYRASSVIDFQRNQLIEISNLFAGILSYNFFHSWKKTLEKYHEVPKSDIEAGIEELQKRELIFFTTTPSLFPISQNLWRRPNTITNAIIEVKRESRFIVSNLVKELLDLGCIALQIRLLPGCSMSVLANVLAEIKGSSLKVLEVIIQYTNTDELNQLQHYIAQEGRLNVLLYEVPTESLSELSSPAGSMSFFTGTLTKRQEDLQTICTNSFEFFTEAQSYNASLNRKVCISALGEIKNDISHARSFGHVSDVSISETIRSSKFQELWHISNDSIEICKDCQFRYSCQWNVDIIHREGKYYKSKICKFDPHTNSWQS